MIGKKDFKPKIFYNFSLEKLVSEDDYYRRLDRILDLTYLYRDCKDLYGKTGNPSIDPVVFFKIQIVGYLENIMYDRQLARRIKDSLSIRLFLGYDIDEDTPCHSTISRTRRRISRAIYEKAFKKILRACVEQDLVDGSHVSIDSTLLKANASLDSLERKTPEYKVDEYYDKTRVLNAEKGLTKDKDKSGNKTHISRRDSDSKIAKKPGKPIDLYYKDNISTDCKKGIIIATETTGGAVNDSQVFPDVVKQSKENLKANNLDLKSTGADKAYCIGSMLKEVEELDVEPYVPLIKRTINTEVWTIDRFTYDSKRDCFFCPNGKILPYKDSSNRSKRYRASNRDCKICPFKKECNPRENIGRHLFLPVYHQQYVNLEKRLKTPMAKKAAKWRKGVERTFSELINNLGIKKINTLGLENAQKKCILAAAAYNLKKLLKYGYKNVISPQTAVITAANSILITTSIIKNVMLTTLNKANIIISIMINKQINKKLYSIY